MSEENKEIMEEIAEEEIVERKNEFCVVALETIGEYNVRDIQTNKSWGKNPYPDTYAVVPDEMVPAIMETRGFFDITVEDGVVTEFTAREIPDIPEPEPEPTEDELQWQAITELEIGQMEQDIALTDLEIAQLEGSAE